MPIASHSCEAHSMIARIHTTPMSGTAWRNIFDKKSVLSSPVRTHHSIKDMPYQYKREPLTPDEANRLGSATEIATRYLVKKPTDNITSVTRTCIPLSLRLRYRLCKRAIVLLTSVTPPDDSQTSSAPVHAVAQNQPCEEKGVSWEQTSLL